MPRYLFWEVTEKCNLRCRHCYNADKARRFTESGSSDPSLEQCKAIVERLRVAGVESVHLLGGEPLLRRDLPDLVRHIRAMGIGVAITTNGTRLTGEWRALVGEVEFDRLLISLDGLTPEVNDEIRGHGTFAKVTQNVREMRGALDEAASGTPLLLSYTLTQTNLDSVLRLPEFLREFGFSGAVIGVVAEMGDAACSGLGIVNAPEMCEALDRLYERFLQFPGLTLQIPNLMPIIQKYFIVRYPGHGMQINRQSRSCPAFDESAVLRSDGVLFPCGPAELLGYRESNCVNPRALPFIPYSGLPALATDCGTQISNREHSRFVEFVHSPDTYNVSESCRQCEFWQRCQVCPLFDMAVNGRMAACDWARAKLTALYPDLLDAVPAKRAGLRMDADGGVAHLSGPNLRKRLRFNDTALAVWNLIDDRQTLGDTVARLVGEFSAEGSDSLQQQVLQFCLMLCERDVLYFRPGEGSYD